MTLIQFESLVCHLVSKVARAQPNDIDPDFNLRGYFDPDNGKQAAFCAAADVLAENGYLDPTDPASALSDVVSFQSI